ncbi:MAG: FAD-dependent oxidoreductase [bacterium]|nr:FAD-dependent oxidoreductase [bacterium]
MLDLIIIGGGPAGVTAGIYASRKKLNTLIIAKDFFGQISKTGQVDNWPGDMAISGVNLALKLEKHLKSFLVEIKEGQKVVAVSYAPVILSQQAKNLGCDPSLITQGDKFTVQIESGEIFEAKALIIATGRNAKTLCVEGEQDFVGKGLSYCSICDAPFFKDKQVAVFGGGNAGFETALDLIKYAKKVFIFEKSDKILADEALVEKAKITGKIEICLQVEILKVEGTNRVQSIVYKNLASGKTMQQPMDGVFVQIGSVPATGFLGKLVDFDEDNEIKVDSKTLETSVKGIFAAGDCNDTKWKQAIIAAGQGATAALSAYEFLQKGC